MAYQHFWICTLLVLALCASACEQAVSEAPSNSDSRGKWETDCPSAQLCFDRPADLLPEPTQAIDSVAGIRRNQQLKLTYDFGRYPLHIDQKNARQTTLTVDGRPAQVSTSTNRIVLKVPNVFEDALFNVHLTMLLEFEGNPPADLADRMFKSVHFKPGG